MEIERSHDLGVAPGEFDELWTTGFHLRALAVCRRSLPDDYLCTLGGQFAASQAILTSVKPPNCESWTVMEEFLLSASSVLAEALGPSRNSVGLSMIEMSTPSLVRFGELARLASRAGAAQLRASADHVMRSAAVQVFGLSEVEVETVAQLKLGLTRMEVAAKLEVSERTVFRRQRSFIRKLEATDLAGATRLGRHFYLFGGDRE